MYKRQLLHLCETFDSWTRGLVMVQLEVADRLVAGPGSQMCIRDRATTMPTLNQRTFLPSNGSKTLDLGVLAPGDYPIVCSMGMYLSLIHI